jgi:hypothetical protein
VTHSTPTQQTGGFVAPGLEGVAEAFERNFAEREEQGSRAETLLRALHEAVA